jgi:hypothetical protein
VTRPVECKRRVRRLAGAVAFGFWSVVVWIRRSARRIRTRVASYRLPVLECCGGLGHGCVRWICWQPVRCFECGWGGRRCDQVLTTIRRDGALPPAPVDRCPWCGETLRVGYQRRWAR